METAFDRLLRIGPVTFKLHVEAHDLRWSRDLLARRLDAFVVEAAGPEVVSVRLRHPHDLGPLQSTHLHPELQTTLAPDGTRRLRRWDVDVTLDADHHGLRGEVAPSVPAIDGCLLPLWFLRTVVDERPRGLMLHAASAVHDGHAWIFPALSGTGKSTLARLTPGDLVLSDEITLLTEHDGAWFAWPSPFWNADRHFEPDPRVHTPFPVAHVALLAQAKATTRFVPLPLDEVLVGVLQQTVRFNLEMASEAPLFSAVMDLLTSLQPDRIGRLDLLLADDPYRTASPDGPP